jgi:GNAT superfamily N-acetyltransferase
MPIRKAAPPALDVVPLTPDRFADLEALFGPRGASSGCWCMYWRLQRAEFRAGKDAGNRAAFRRYVDGHVPGLLAYQGGTPVGWVAVEPRAAYPRLEGIPALAPVDAQPVWSIPCFFVARGSRGKGVSRALVAAAVEHARGEGARILEAYPSDVDGHRQPGSIFLGVASAFRAAGFEEVARRDPDRPVLRLALTPRGAPRARARGAARSSPRSPRRRATGSRRGR